MKVFHQLANELRDCPQTWLVTGCAGFIGSHLVEFLLRHDQKVTGLDNFSTGHRRNLADVQRLVTVAQWERFRLIEGDIRDIGTCRRAVAGVDHVLQQAALGSVPRSVDDPLASNDSNINGFLNILVAAKDAHVKSFVYAASSAADGDHAGLPKREDIIGKPLSPYAVTKYVNELYAEAFSRCYGFESVGLRYFNVFGKRQDPDGAYAAVIPKWIRAMCEGSEVVINGDGCSSRDFCHVANVVQANILASMLQRSHGSAIYNVAVNGTTTLNQLYAYLKAILRAYGISVDRPPVYGPFRDGDIRHSQADIGKAVRELGYAPEYQIFAGLETTVPWYLRQRKTTDARRPAPRAPGRPAWPAGLPAQAPAATRAVHPLAE
ncbi:MAG: SDR family oxidoreductase [Lysobacteraceae bacterium]|nr:MAG: SDR family oxidoreductase [Xanthomonadaceae bacterium]